jgi:replicative DNA helicase
MKDFGKIPPQSLEAEKAVLGGFMIEPTHHEFIELIQPCFFYKLEHQSIFQAISDLYRSRKNIDIITVTEKVGSNSTPFYVTSLTGNIAGSLHLPEHLAIVIEKYLRRELIRSTTKLFESAYDDSQDVDDIVSQVNDLSISLQGMIHRNFDVKSLYEVMEQCIEKAKRRKMMSEQNLSFGIPMPLGKMQKILGGWHPGELTILAARPSMGKTAFSLKIATHCAERNHKVLFVSLEMSSELLVDRILTGKSNVDSEKYKNGTVSKHELYTVECAFDEMSHYNIEIVDQGSMSVDDIYSLIKKQRPDIAIIDYIQLIGKSRGFKFDNRNQEIGYVSRRLKMAAKDFQLPVIALSQLNRGVEGRVNKHPLLSDLRESGDLEQDADLVMFLYRNSYYDESDKSQVMEIDIKKNRNGRVGYIHCTHNDALTDFNDILDESEPELVY